MRYLLAFALFVLAAFAQPALAGSTLRAEGEKVFLERNGASTELAQEMYPAQPVGGGTLRFVGFNPDDAKEMGLLPGIYLFDEKGGVAAFVPTDDAEICADVRLSPGGTVLAVDAGTWLVRSWTFYAYPSLKRLGDVAYYQNDDKPALIWNGETGALFPSMNTDGHGRTCGYDPCGPVSVSYFSFADNKSATVFAGDDLCDFTLLDFDGADGTIKADKLCLPTPKDWETFPEGVAGEAVSAKLP